MTDILTFGLYDGFNGIRDEINGVYDDFDVINVDFGVSTFLVDRSRGLSCSCCRTFSLEKVGKPRSVNNVESQVMLTDVSTA